MKEKCNKEYFENTTEAKKNERTVKKKQKKKKEQKSHFHPQPEEKTETQTTPQSDSNQGPSLQKKITKLEKPSPLIEPLSPKEEEKSHSNQNSNLVSLPQVAPVTKKTNIEKSTTPKTTIIEKASYPPTVQKVTTPTVQKVSTPTPSSTPTTPTSTQLFYGDPLASTLSSTPSSPQLPLQTPQQEEPKKVSRFKQQRLQARVATPKVAPPAASPAGEKFYTAAEVARHNNERDCWVIVNGQVLDVTKWLPHHPGGRNAILLFAGLDATEKWNMLHESGVIAKYCPDTVIGKLQQ